MERKETVKPAVFQQLDIRAGRIERAEPFPEARKPFIRLWVDFGGEVGTLQSAAQLTRRYSPESLQDTLVLGVVNLPPLRIAGFTSECLVLGVVDPGDAGDVVLVRPEAEDVVGWSLA